DAEIERLPAALRAPIVLCCLEGRTRDEAAEAIGCSVAAVKSRLERGRGRLRRQLSRRGIELPAAFLAVGLSSGRVRGTLRARAVQSALGAAPSTVAALIPATASIVPRVAVAFVSLAMAGTIGVAMFAGDDPPQKPPPKPYPPLAALARRPDPEPPADPSK